MAFCRWISSDLYVYPEDGYGEQEGQGVMTCCCCRLSAEGDNFTASTPRAFYDHLEAHEAAGHHVEQGYRELIREIDAEAHLWFGVGH